MARYIDADKLKKDLYEAVISHNKDRFAYIDYDFEALIDDAETADVQEVKHGEWKTATAFEVFGGDVQCWIAHGDPIVSIYCTKCGFEPYAGDDVSISDEAIEVISNYNFCPHCGANWSDYDD